jgi:HK97 family phage prohead protease
MNKTFKFEVKEMGEAGSFVGLASVYGNVDLGNDVVMPGAFTKTIHEKGEVPILWQHDPREPIGIGRISDSPDGLVIKADLALESPTAAKAYALLKKGVLKGLSIGYDAVRDEIKAGVRHLKEVALWEVSLVTFPMNQMANVIAVKGEMADFEKRLSDLEALVASHAAKFAPAMQPAAEHDKDAPEILHPSLDRIAQILRGEL